MEDHGNIQEDQAYSSSLRAGVARRGAAYSGLAVSKLIIIKQFVTRIEACSLFLVVRDIVTKNFD